MSLIRRAGDVNPWHSLENKENLWWILETWAAKWGGERLIFLIYLIQTNSIKFPYYRITRARSCGWVGNVIEQGYWGAWTHLCCVLLHKYVILELAPLQFLIYIEIRNTRYLTWARRNDVDGGWYGNLQARLAVQDNKTYSLSIGKQVGIPLAKLIIRF